MKSHNVTFLSEKSIVGVKSVMSLSCMFDTHYIMHTVYQTT